MGSRDKPGLQFNSPHKVLLSLASLVENHMGGTSGVVSDKEPVKLLCTVIVLQYLGEVFYSRLTAGT